MRGIAVSWSNPSSKSSSNSDVQLKIKETTPENSWQETNQGQKPMCVLTYSDIAMSLAVVNKHPWKTSPIYNFI